MCIPYRYLVRITTKQERGEVMENEERLQKELREKNENTLREIMERYEREVFLTARSFTGGGLSLEDIQEVVNDAFYQLWTHASSLSPDKGTVRAYLIRTVCNLARNKIRKKAVQTCSIREEDYIEVPDLLEKLEREERKQILETVLRKLKREDREILIRYYFLYQSTEEIGTIMGMKRETVKSRLSRGRKKLQLYLMERGIRE